MREPGDDREEVAEVRELKDAMRLRWTRPRHLGAPIGPGDARDTSWHELVEQLSTFRRTKAKEDAGAWCPATFISRSEAEKLGGCCNGPHKLDKRCRLRGADAVARKSVNVESVSLLVIDVDDGGRTALNALLERLVKRGVRHWWHTTHTSAERFRLVVPLSQPVPANRWWDVWHWGTKALGARASADASCKDASRLYYMPATSLDRTDDGECGGAKNGRALDVEALFAQGPWPDQPRSSSTTPRVFPAATETELWAAQQDLEKHGDAVEGKHGDSRTFVAAAILAHDWALTPEEAWPLFAEWNRKHAKPMWSEEELHEKLENSGAYSTGEYGRSRGARTAYQLEVARVEAELEARLGKSSPRTEPATWTPVDALLATEFPKADWLIRGLVAKDTLTIIGADPKASKTWCLLELALAVGTGGKAFGEFPAAEASPVLLFLNEDSTRSVRNRFRALAQGHGVPAHRMSRIAVRTREPLDLGDRTQLAQLIVDIRMAPERPALIGLDPLRNLHSAEENSSTEMRTVLRSLGAIRELCGCSLAVVHHSAKRGENDNRTAGSRMRGSSAIDGYRDGLISLEETEKGDAGDEIANQVVVDLKAFKAAGRFALRLKIEDDGEGEAVRATWQLAEPTERAAKKRRSASIEEQLPSTRKDEVGRKMLEWFRNRHKAAARSGQAFAVAQGAAVEEISGLINASEPTVRKALEGLEQRGMVIREAMPQTTRGQGQRVRFQLRLAEAALVDPEREER